MDFYDPDPEESLVDFYLENVEFSTATGWTLAEHFYSLPNGYFTDDKVKKPEELKCHLRLDDVQNDLMTMSTVTAAGFQNGRNLGYFATTGTSSSLRNNKDVQDNSTDGKNAGRGRIMEIVEGDVDVEDGEIEDTDVQPATLLSKAKILSFNGKDLSVGFKNSKKILDYDEFHTLKHIAFQKWLVAHKSVLTNTNVNFVCNVGRIGNILLTPLLPETSWQFYAVRYNDIIFLFNAAPEGRTPSTVPSHCGVVYKRLVTGENPEVDGVDEFDKVWAVTESMLGNHKFILLTGGQVDIHGRKVNTRAYNPRIFAKRRSRLISKFLNYWAFTAAAGAEHLLLGTRSDRHVLENSELLSLEGIWKKTTLHKLGQKRCYNFTEKVLNWIQGHFVENDRYHLKHYNWAGLKNEWRNVWADEDSIPYVVECNTITDDLTIRTISSQILPEFFINGAFQDDKKL